MQSGQTFAARFVIERLAAAGGMGSVYRALDQQTGQPVALKLITNDAHAARFVREAEVLASFTHPAIVRYVAHGVDPGGHRFLAMEWLEGRDLGAYLSERGMAMTDAVRLVVRVAEALGHAHARGVVHRDVKPSNLFLVGGRPDDVRVIDFGIARVEAGGLATNTRRGIVLGTAGYLAPEQARGEGVSPRSDVFSLGCVFFELLTGRPPFAGEDFVVVLAKILAERAPSARELRAEVPEVLDELVLRMLAKEPTQRPADGEAVAAALRAFGEDTVPRSHSPRRVSELALTAHEQKMVSVILLSPDAGGLASTQAPTAAPVSVGPRWQRMQRVVDGMGAQAHPMLGGSALVTLTRTGAATDHAARVARGAMALRAAWGEVPTVVATGRAAMSGQVPVGALIERAAQALRLFRASGGRGLLVDEVTAGLLGERFELRGAPELRGFELVGEHEPTTGERRLAGRPSACHGRERELGVLLGAWDGVVATSSPQVVVVTAPAGVGKSRLRQEFVRRLRAGEAPPEVWLAAGDPVGAHAPFGMLAQWIRGAAGLAEREAPEVRRQRLRARLARHLDGAALEHAAAFLGEVVGATLGDEASGELRAARRDPRLMGEQVWRALGAWLEAEAAAGPVLLVLEDLHWGDLPSVRAISAVLRSLGESAVLLLALGRSELDREFTEELSGVGSLSLELGPLARRASERIVREALGEGLAAEQVTRLIERSEGNALCLEELIRAVAAGAGEELPETILAIVAARLDRLDASSRRVLRAASIFGASFDARGVAALLGGADRTTQVGDRLRALVEAEVLAVRGETYTFRHTLLREASYALLTDADRVLGHQLAGRWLAEAGQTEAAVLAEHFARGEQPDKAARWSLRAAERALEGSSLPEALGWSARARSSGAQGEVLGAVRRVEACVHSLRDDNLAAAEAGEEALALLPRGGLAWYLAAAELATTSLRLGEPTRLVVLAASLAAADVAPGALGARQIALARTAIHLSQTGHLGPAEHLRECLRGLPMPGDDDPAARAWRTRLESVEALRAGEPERYLLLTREVVADFERAGDRSSACAQRGNLGYALAELGAFEEAEASLRETLARARELGLRSVAGIAQHNLGLVVARRGAFAEAGSLQRSAIEGFAAQRHRRLEGFARLYLARTLVWSGDAAAGAAEAARGLQLLGDAMTSRALALAGQAEAWLAAGQAEDARRAAGEASELLARLGGIEEGESLIRWMEARTRVAVGDHAGAQRAIEEAARRLHERASRITDAGLRASFLGGPVEHADTLALAAGGRER